MIKSKEEYYSILERLRELNFNQKLSKNLQAKLEAFEEMEELVNLTIPVVVVNEAEKEFKPCGEGDNICNCKNASDCGYSSEVKLVCPICEEEKPLINNLYCDDCNNTIANGLGLTN